MILGQVLLLVALFAGVSSQWQGFGQVHDATEYKDDPEALVLHRDHANNFRVSHGRSRRDLWEECYDEGCSKEEVEEVVGGRALYQYYYGWRCMKLYGGDWTYSGNPSRLQCCNCIRGRTICASGYSGYSRGSSRTCRFGHYRNIYAVYMENGCNDGELASWRLNFDDPSKSVRYVYNVGCREKKSFTTVRGARSYTATNIGGGGGDGRVSNYKLGWFGYNAKHCGNPGSPSYGYRRGDNFYETSKVYFYCNKDYVRVGNAYRTCQWHGWDGSVPRCLRLCQPGYYSSSGHDSCSACPIGRYQSSSGATSCHVCPSGKSTTKTASRFASDCHHKCSRVICTLQPWSSWSDMATPINGVCASESRRRVYHKTWEQILNPDGCNNVAKTCNPDIVDIQEKVIYCDALAKPAHGLYTPAACYTTRQKCKTPCVFACDKEFQPQGDQADFTRTCQRNGQWSYSKATCKDVTAPKITCPASMSVNNDRRKGFARVNLPLPTASDNTGEQPSVKITSPGITPIYDFPITSSGPGTMVQYTATDDAGLTADCRFYVKVKDVEKPEVLSCPSSPHTVETMNDPSNVVLPEPKFKDNFDPEPAMDQNRLSGESFPWGVYNVRFNATDKAGNKASCAYSLQVGPYKCKLFDAPAYGVRACTLQSNNVVREFMCTVQCKQGYEFTRPLKYHAYVCKGTGKWHGYKKYSFNFPGEQIDVKDGEKPWPDCAMPSTPTGVEKKLTVYAGACLAGDEQTKNQIKQNFIDKIKAEPMLNRMLCMSNKGIDCLLSNVKVYCGTNSRRKRRGLGDTNVIEVEYKVMDLDPTSQNSEERKKLVEYANQIVASTSVVQAAVKRAAASAVKVSDNDVDVEDGVITGACVVGKVLVIKTGSGSDLSRSECVDCAAGTYFDLTTKACKTCAVGTYQDEEGEEYCKSCPGGTTTEGLGTSKLHGCKDICRSGEYSATGLETCIACPVGTYQSANQSKSCTPCPAGTSTLDVGTDSLEECKKFCAAGHYSPDNGLGACVPCPRGSYQPHARGTSCIRCSQGMTTLDDGATLLSQCKSGCGMDFEHGIDHWVKTGTAFDNQPTYGDNPSHRNRESSQHQGNYWIGGAENRPSPAGTPGARGPGGGDPAQGTLTSPSFRISGKVLSFLIGGGCDINKVRAELVVDGSVARRSTGKCFESMERAEWDVTEFQGKTALVRLVDSTSGIWGHINFDDLSGDTCI